MIYHCERCGAALRPAADACPVCGKRFPDAIPADADVPDTSVDGLLSGRTARGRDSGPLYASPSVGNTPGMSGRPGGGRGPIGITVGICLAAVAVLTLAVWGASTLWSRGPGGDAAYVQHNLAGNADTERGDYAAADDEYSQMIALRPRRVDGYLLRAITEDKAGLYSRSIADDTTALSLTNDPIERGDLLYNRAEAQAGRGGWRQAIADYSQSYQQYALDHAPQEVASIPDRQEDAVRGRADARWECHDYAGAIADCTALIAHSRIRPDDYGIRAKCEAALSRNMAARADFARALAVDSTYMPGYAGLANLDDKLHHDDMAVTVYRRATLANPDSVDCWGSLGWFQYEVGQIPAAIATDRRAQSLDPNQAWINYNLALCYAVSGDGARATAEYAFALSRGAQESRSGALSDLKAALAHQPGSATLRRALAQVERGPVAGAVTPPAITPFVPLAPPVPKSFASMLAPDTSLNGYAVRAPAGYTLQQSRQTYLDGSGTTDLWLGPQRSDGTMPSLQIIVSEDDGRMSEDSDSAQVEQQYLNNLNDSHTQLTSSTITPCMIGGRSFVQASWSGVGRRTGKPYAGVVYISVTPGQYIEITSHDASPYSRSTLPLLTAAALTFRKV